MNKQEFQYNYRFIKTSWGIYISFCGALCNDEESEAEYETIENTIKYIISHKISDKEKELIVKGIHLFYNMCHNNISVPTKEIIYFDNLVYSLCDYQDDGIIVGIIECLSFLLKINPPIIKGIFDKIRNKYCYYLNNVALETYIDYLF